MTVYAELPHSVRRLDPGGTNPRVRVLVEAPPYATIRHKRVNFYLAARSARRWRRVDSALWRRHGRRVIVAVGSYPSGRLGRRDSVLACIRERRSDGFGRPSPLDPLCGHTTLPRMGAAIAMVRPRRR